jgi:fermentation-respiration switch protein FrsA (DUF1100 family)
VGSELVRPVNHPVVKPANLDAQEIRLPGDGHTIAAWWVDRGPGTPVVVLLHGIRADRSSMLGRARVLLAHGYSVLMIDLQAHGDTPGDAITLGWRESADVSTALAWVRAEAPGRKLGVIGTSLGGASVLLKRNPAGFDAVVLEAVYPSISRAIENRIRLRLGVLAPVLTPLLLAQIPLRLHVSPSDLEPIRHVGELHAPLMVVAGSKDEHTTLPESLELFETAKGPKRLWVVSGASHQDFQRFDPPAYEKNVVGFLDRYLKTGVTASVSAGQGG